MSIRQFYWADPHFGHKQVLTYEKRPFASIDEMNKTMIENYNRVVGPNDRCVWLGDCFLTAKHIARQIMEQLNGVKIVVLGNHDHSPTQMLGLGFAYACYEMKIKIAGYDVLLSHYPYANDQDSFHEIKHDLYRPKNSGLWLLHGHCHSKSWGIFKDRMINVGVDLWGFKPIPHSFFEDYIQKHSR